MVNTARKVHESDAEYAKRISDRKDARIEALERQLAEEKALGDRFNDAVYGRAIMAEVVAAYRKARGM